MKKFKIAALMAFVLLVLSGCGSESSQPDSSSTNEQVNINGAVEKGPFIVGSTVTINTLTDKGENTGSTIVTNTVDDLGNFRFAIGSHNLVQITSTGYYRNEITGELSSGILSLRSIYKASSESEQHAFVNLLTHLTSNRVLQLIRVTDLSYEQAIQQAESEFLLTFEHVIKNQTEFDFSSLSIYESQGSMGSAYLIAVSSIIYQYAIDRSNENATTPDAELALLVNEIEEDFGVDGKIDDENKIELLRNAHSKINPQNIMNNIQRWVEDKEGYAIPDVNNFLDSDLDGVVNSSDDDDDNDGIDDLYDENPYLSDFNVRDQQVNTIEDVSVSIDISSNSPATGSINVVIIQEPRNGVLRHDYPELTYVPNDNYNGSDEFKYVLTQSSYTSDEVRVLVSINSINDEPSISNVPNLQADANDDIFIEVESHDLDGDNLQFRAINLPDWASIDTSTGVISGHPLNENSGEYSEISIAVSDGTAEVYTNNFVINIAINPWYAVTSMPTSRRYHAAAYSNEKIYVFGGESSSTYTSYDTDSTDWSSSQQMPSGATEVIAHAIESSIYILGGYRSGDHVNYAQKFDPKENSWAPISAMPTTRSWFASEVVNNKIYVIAGSIPTDGWTGDVTNHYTDIVEEYDPITDRWESKASLPVKCGYSTSATLNGKIYIFGGYLDQCKDKVYVYDPAQNEWTEISTIPSYKIRSQAIAVGDKIYIFGGYSNKSGWVVYDNVSIFNPVDNSWSTGRSKLPTPRYGHSATLIGKEIFLIGGSPYSGPKLKSVEIYNPNLDKN